MIFKSVDRKALGPMQYEFHIPICWSFCFLVRRITLETNQEMNSSHLTVRHRFVSMMYVARG
jgi:hypothetical protein